MPDFFEKLAKREKNHSEIREGFENSDIDLKETSWSQFRKKYLAPAFITELVKSFAKGIIGKAYYGFCLSLVSLGVGITIPSFSETIFNVAIAFFDIEPTPASPNEFWIKIAIGLILILAGITLAYRHSQKP